MFAALQKPFRPLKREFPQVYVKNWTIFCNSVLNFLAQYKNNVCAINFPIDIGTFTDEPETVAPNCIM